MNCALALDVPFSQRPPIERIEARAADLGGGMVVRRALPTRQRRMVGAWCFLEHAGPLGFAPGQGMRVGAHPHTGLQTFTRMKPFGEQILMWWNFVGSGKDEVAKAQRDWETGSPRFGRVQGYEGPRLAAPALPWSAS